MKKRIPTFEEVIAHFNDPTVQKTHQIEPSVANHCAKMFFDYYESVGWYRGRTPIQKWKSCLTVWQKSFKDIQINDVETQKDKIRREVQERLQRKREGLI